MTRNPRSCALFAQALRSLPGGNTRTGVWFDPFPPYVERGEGAYLWDVDGHRLLDFVFNNSLLILGHAHPVVVEAIQRQAALGTGFNRPTELEIELAELLPGVPSAAPPPNRPRPTREEPPCARGGPRPSPVCDQ